jgi:hypothetical protein
MALDEKTPQPMTEYGRDDNPRKTLRWTGPLPPSGLGPDGKIVPMSDQERVACCEAARRRLAEVARMIDEEAEPPDALEQFMRGIDETRPHRPLFRGLH